MAEEVYRKCKRWRPSRPLPPPEDTRRKPWGLPLECHTDIYVKSSKNQEPTLVYKFFSFPALVLVSPVVRQACYGPDNMRKRDSKHERFRSLTFGSCLPSGMKLVLDFVRDLYVETLGSPSVAKGNARLPKPQPPSGRPLHGYVIAEPANISNIYDAINAYYAGCILGIDDYLGALRKRICNGTYSRVRS